MPFTPFHLGPAFLVAVLGYRRLDPVTLLVASIAVDVRAVLVLVGVLGGAVHGPLHTLPGAVAVGLLVATGCYAVRGVYRPLLQRAGYDTASTPQKFVAAGLVGSILLHLLPDALLYGDVGLLEPFHPLLGPPMSDPLTVYVATVLMGVSGVLVVVVRRRNGLREGATE